MTPLNTHKHSLSLTLCCTVYVLVSPMVHCACETSTQCHRSFSFFFIPLFQEGLVIQFRKEKLSEFEGGSHFTCITQIVDTGCIYYIFPIYFLHFDYHRVVISLCCWKMTGHLLMCPYTANSRYPASYSHPGNNS